MLDQTMNSAQFGFSDWKLHVQPILEDNYAYVWEGPETCAIIDPGEAPPLLKVVDQLAKPCTQIVVTHGHWDHNGDLEGCRSAWPEAKVLSARGCAGEDLLEGAVIDLAGAPFEIIETPGHIAEQVALHAPQLEVAFVADALFVAGCGRLFTGDAPLMWSSLLKIRKLPPNTRLFCGHEYTLSNLDFALTLFPRHKELAEQREKMQDLLLRGMPTVPTTVEQEAETNMFLRCDQPELKAALNLEGAADAEVFAALRKRKDQS